MEANTHRGKRETHGTICYHEKEVVPSDPIAEKGRVP
jgi:hypothetical protein